MSIPLVQNNEKDSINTSIIAIKRQIERINALLGLSNSEEIDTSVFATKTELEDAVTQIETDLAPVDEVTADNMQSVTSNGVANALGYLVWENPDSTQSFPAQDITFDRQVPSEYSKLKIEFRPLNTENYFLTSECVIGYNTYLTIPYVVLTGNSRAVISDRLARNSSRTGISFSEGRFWQSSNNTQQEINTRCIPTRIWAIK